ncbi:hypothetical protein HDU67_007319 [Dinochytrium kinnereticum]|nr:hypothetical protein HDU67_007319 [Dinochytrium kinnereticum]
MSAALASAEALQCLDVLCAKTEVLWSLILAPKVIRESKALRDAKLTEAERSLNESLDMLRECLGKLGAIKDGSYENDAEELQLVASDDLDELREKARGMREVAYDKSQKLKDLVDLCIKMEAIITQLTDPDPWQTTERKSHVGINPAKSTFSRPSNRKTGGGGGSTFATPFGTPKG